MANFTRIDALMQLPVQFRGDVVYVLQRLPLGHQEAQYYALHLDLLLFCMRFPHVRGIPLLDLRTRRDDGSLGSEPLVTTTGSGYNMWPTVKLDNKECCVDELLGLLQFEAIPRNPQRVNPKCANWGYDDFGRVQTSLHQAGQVVTGAGEQVV